MPRTSTPVICAVLLGLCGCGSAEDATVGQSGDWRAEIKELRISITSSAELESGETRNIERFDAYLEKATGLPVRVYRVNDYNAAIQALSSGQVDMVSVGAGAYANIDDQIGDKAAPILTVRGPNGDTGYYSALIVKSESPYRRLADLKGRSLAVGDRNSTSGYLLPRRALAAAGMDMDRDFSRVGVTGGHPQSVMAVIGGQYDAAFVYAGGGTPETGLLTSAYSMMADRGLIPQRAVRAIWHAGPMPNSPFVVRTDRPQAVIDLLRGAMAALPFEEPEVWAALGVLPGTTLTAVDRGFYTDVIEMRDEALAAERGGAATDSGENGAKR